MITVALFAMIGLSLPTGFGGWRRLLWLVAVGSQPPCPPRTAIIVLTPFARPWPVGSPIGVWAHADSGRVVTA